MSAARERIQAIDLLRGWAVIVMVETHILNATLLGALREGSLFAVLTFVNGLVAPAFIFASGLAYAVATRRKMKEYLAGGPALYRQLLRLLSILAIGYLLHIPRFNFHHLLYEAGPAAWASFFQVDVLHCIAVTLLFLQLLFSIFRREDRTYRAAGLGAVVVVLATPLIWMVDWTSVMPLPLAAYLNGLHGSLFPLFPWSAFLLAGAVTGHALNRARDRQVGGEGPAAMGGFTTRLGLYALAAVVLSFAIEPLALHVYPVYDYWKTSPSFVLLRAGLVMGLCYGMFLYESRRGVSADSVVALFGRESLLVYVAHLTLIYGRFGSFCFADRAAASYTYGYVLMATAVLLVLMFGLAYVWSRMKRGPIRVRQMVELALVAVFLVVFFFAPFS